ncbi:MAG: hypothetical protein QUV05_06035 [Phycisphaerae bacterium]|nr:hypothetical protein [Phycisphaerae bacterium]
MMLSRRNNTALMVLKLDAAIPAKLLQDLESHKPPIRRVLPVTLPPLAI